MLARFLIAAFLLLFFGMKVTQHATRQNEEAWVIVGLSLIGLAGLVLIMGLYKRFIKGEK
jgi:hypothetical protein